MVSNYYLLHSFLFETNRENMSPKKRAVYVLSHDDMFRTLMITSVENDGREEQYDFKKDVRVGGI
jgi:hypothetical protein